MANEFATAFSPLDVKEGTVKIAAAAGSQHAALPVPNARGNTTMQIFNAGNAPAQVNWGIGDTLEATANSYVVAPGAVVVVDVDPLTNRVAAIGDGDVYFTKGFGV